MASLPTDWVWEAQGVFRQGLVFTVPAGGKNIQSKSCGSGLAGPVASQEEGGLWNHGCFEACREALFLAPTCHGCRVEWALDTGKQRVSAYAKEGVQCQNTCSPPTPAPSPSHGWGE